MIRTYVERVPEDPQEAIHFLHTQLQELQLQVEQLLLDLSRPISSPPNKPRDGMIKYADGLGWNPGGGRGLYFFNQNIWRRMD